MPASLVFLSNSSSNSFQTFEVDGQAGKREVCHEEKGRQLRQAMGGVRRRSQLGGDGQFRYAKK